MSDYTKTTNFTVKDSLSPGDPNKIVKGAEIDTEFTNIETASASKLDNNVSATDKLLGRSSAGAGPVEEITCTDFAQSLLDDTSASIARTTLGLGTIATVNSPVPIANGGTGATTANMGLNALLPSQATHANKVLTTDGTNTSWTSKTASGLADPGSNGVVARTALDTTVARTITAGTNISVSNGDGVSGNPTVAFSGTLPLANGGTGATTASAARTNLGLGSTALENFDLDSGTYSPSITGSTPSIGCYFLRIGNIVWVYGAATKDATTEAANISLPISSNFSATADAQGFIVEHEATTVINRIQAAAATNNITAGVINANAKFTFHFMYIIK